MTGPSLDGLPDDLARVLRDQSIIVPQDSAVFDLIAKWAKAQSTTVSAGQTPPQPAVQPGPSLDLDALREEMEWLARGARSWVEVAPTRQDLIVDQTRAVLALVEEQRKENERLRKGLTRLCDYGAIADEFVRAYAAAILAGSPAANEEAASAPWAGLEGWNVGVEFRGDDVVVMARAPGQSVWRDLLTVTR